MSLARFIRTIENNIEYGGELLFYEKDLILITAIYIDRMATDQFSLCWNNFHSNLSSGFHSLYQSEDFVDVTLAADGRYLKAHKMVLSVCSQYFKELFHANPCKHPIVILKDVSYSALRDLLQFMYLGEVSVSQEELSNLMKVAELLQIKGLTEENVDTSHMNQNGLKNIHVTDVTSLTDPRSYLKRAKTFKKSRTEVPAKISKSNSSSECRDSQSPSTLEIDSNPSLLVESELIEPVKPKEEPADYSTESGNQSEHSIPDMDVSSMLDTNLGETSSSSCWKSDTKTFGPSGSSTAGGLRFLTTPKGRTVIIHNGHMYTLSHQKDTKRTWNIFGNEKQWVLCTICLCNCALLEVLHSLTACSAAYDQHGTYNDDDQHMTLYRI
ncbi:uncharacterized protein CBL_06972 [Carabus blaptoides fortunei]